MTEAEPYEYEGFDVKELKTLLEERELATKGSRSVLVRRLQEHDERMCGKYDKWKCPHLIQELYLRDQATRGNRKQLIARLIAHDNATDADDDEGGTDESDEDEDATDGNEDNNDNVCDVTGLNLYVSFEKGTQFKNIFRTSHDRPSAAEKKALKRLRCVFCWNGTRSGLIHVVDADEDRKRTNTYYLAPGCQSCNKSFDVLTVKVESARMLIRTESAGRNLRSTRVYIMDKRN
jgi:hypothetical protein